MAAHNGLREIRLSHEQWMRQATPAQLAIYLATGGYGAGLTDLRPQSIRRADVIKARGLSRLGS